MPERRGQGVRWLPRAPAPLAGCWYLDDHWDVNRHERTYIGECVFRAKTYDGKPGQRNWADRLASYVGEAARTAFDHGLFPLRSVDIVVPVPAFPPKQPYNLPDILASGLAESIDRPLWLDLLKKTATTPPAKTSFAEDVASAVEAAHAVTRRLDGETVLLVDDLVHEGTTLAALGRVLQGSGAGSVGGFVATRARKGMTL